MHVGLLQNAGNKRVPSISLCDIMYRNAGINFLNNTKYFIGIMKDFKQLITGLINAGTTKISLSKPFNKEVPANVRIRPVSIKGKTLYQVTTPIGDKRENTYKEIHENIGLTELSDRISAWFPAGYGQILIETADESYTMLAGRKGNVTVIKNKAVSKQSSVPAGMHNKEKQYLIKEGTYVPFLEDLGIMTKDGHIVKSKFDKFRQINRYLEFVDDILDKLPTDRKVTIIDFGCGRSYLTFALYYYLSIKNNRSIHIIGLDLKSDVIANCNRLRDKYGYDDLEFIQGDIEHFNNDTHVDMVISLHACDTATDYALFKGIKWNAEVIMAVPCCQHELNSVISGPEIDGVLQYGILKDRLSAVITDAMRANILKEWGYDTSVLEFIDMEHTPKNIMIRAVKRNGMTRKGISEKEERLEKLAGADITLKRLLENEKNDT